MTADLSADNLTTLPALER